MALASCAVAALVSAAAPVLASDRSGVRPNAVEIPSGAGTISGLGQALTVSPSTGASSYAIPVPLPSGAGGHAPSLSLVYSSGAPAGEVGVSWSLGLPVIKRSLRDGLPTVAGGAYAANQTLRVAGVPGVGELVATAAGRWRPCPDEAIAYVEAIGGREDAGLVLVTRDGMRFTFGAAPEARVVGPSGTFEWHVTEVVDRFGHRTSYEYTNEHNAPKLQSIAWNTSAGEHVCSVEFGWEQRADAIVSFLSGAESVLDERIAAVRVYRGAHLHRELLLDFADDSGLSRLQRVDMVGWDGVTGYPTLELAYTDLTNEGVSVTTLADATTSPVRGVSLSSNTAELIDFNGDALPDVLEMSPTAAGGSYRLFLNNGAGFDAPRLLDPAGTTYLGDSVTGRERATTFVDVDGDALADIVSAPSAAPGEAIRFYSTSRTGAGGVDISRTGQPLGGSGLSISPFHPATRLSDVDMDRRPDLVSIDGSSREIRVALGRDDWATTTVVGLAPETGLDLDRANRFLADINGDGLDDIVVYEAGNMRYFPGTGHGLFDATARRVANAPDLDREGLVERHLRDVTGDGLPDMVGLGATSVFVWPLRGTGEFGPRLAPLVAIPERTPTSEFRLVDMNANGTVDLLWVDTVSPDPRTGGTWVYVDFLPQGSPALLRSVRNGLGVEIAMDYLGMGSVALLAAQIPDLAEPAIPEQAIIPQMLLHRRTVSDGVSVREVTEFVYAGGYFDYDRVEFLGFRRVLTRRPETAGGSVDGRTAFAQFNQLEEYFVGATSDPDDHRALAGRLRESRAWDGTARFTAIEPDSRVSPARASGSSVVTRNTWSVVELGETSLDGDPVVRAVQTAEEVTRTEFADADDSRATTRVEWLDFDAYGFAGTERRLGLVDDPDDDVVVERTFVHDPGRWRFGLQSEEVVSSARGGRAAGTRWYYDGQPLGRLGAHGVPTRQDRWIDGDRWVAQLEQEFDAHGNVVRRQGPDGQDERTRYDATGTFVTEVTRVTGNPGRPELRWEARWNPEQGDALVAVVNPDGGVERLEYDGLGRPTAVFRPGDVVPSLRYAYEPGAPVSRTVTSRSTSSGVRREIMWQTGGGEIIGRATQLDDDSWLAEDFVTRGPLGWAYRSFEPHVVDSDWVSNPHPAPDPSVPSRATTYDSFGRAARETDAEGRQRMSLYGARSVVRLDGRDLDGSYEGGGAYPVRVWADGYGRTIALDEARADGIPFRYEFEWDAADRLTSGSDAHGGMLSADWDGRGLPVAIRHQDFGTVQMEYDTSGRLVARSDADGRRVTYAYDALDRLVTRSAAAGGVTRSTTWTYDTAPDGGGQVASIVGPASSVEYGYDVRGRVITETWTVGEVGPLVFGNELDASDRVVARSYPGGRTLRFELDGADRVVSVPGVLDAASYDWIAGGATLSSRGRLVEASFGDGRGLVFDRDRSGRMVGLLTTGHQAEVAMRRDIDANGSTSGIRDQSSAEHRVFADHERLALDEVERLVSFGEGRFEFSYDVSNRLTAESAGHDQRRIVYGAAGSGLPRGIGGEPLEWSPSGRLVDAGSTDLEWGPDGAVDVVRQGAEEVRLSYDHDGRLIAWNGPAGGVVTPTPDYRVQNGVGWIEWRVGGSLVLHVPDGPRQTLRSGHEDARGLAPIGVGRRGTSPPPPALLFLLALAGACALVARTARYRASSAGASMVCALGLALACGDGGSGRSNASWGDAGSDVAADVVGAEDTPGGEAADAGLDIGADGTPDPNPGEFGFTVLDWVGNPAATSDEAGVLHRWAFAPYGAAMRLPAASASAVVDIALSHGFTWGDRVTPHHVQLGARLYDTTLGFFASVDPLLFDDPGHSASTPARRETVRYGLANPTTHADPTGLAVDFGAAVDGFGQASQGIQTLSSFAPPENGMSFSEGLRFGADVYEAFGQVVGGALTLAGAITGDQGLIDTGKEVSGFFSDVAAVLNTAASVVDAVEAGIDQLSTMTAEDAEAAFEELWSSAFDEIAPLLGFDDVMAEDIIMYGAPDALPTGFAAGTATFQSFLNNGSALGGTSIGW